MGVKWCQERHIFTVFMTQHVLYVHKDRINNKLVTNKQSSNLNKKSQTNMGKAASPSLTAENNYAKKSPLVTMGCPTFTPKTAPI